MIKIKLNEQVNIIISRETKDLLDKIANETGIKKYVIIQKALENFKVEFKLKLFEKEIKEMTK